MSSFGRRLTRRIAAVIAVDLILVAAALALVLHESLGASWRRTGAVAAALAGIALVLFYLTLRVPFRRIRENLAALTDGVRGFADGDFSLRLRVSGNDEISEIVTLYNEMGSALRTERNETLQKELLLETVFQATPLAVILTSESDRIVLANRAANELFTSGGRLEGHRLSQLLPVSGSVREAFRAETDALFTSGEETFHLRHRTFHLNTRRHVLWIVNRITPELRRQEIEIWKRAIRMLNHELNNSLAPIRSLFHSASAIRDRPEHRHKLAEIDATIEERLDHLQRFLDGYAQFARLPSPRRVAVSWADLLGSVQPLFPFHIGETSSSGEGFFDRTQIEQVVINLVRNALEAGSPADDVMVSVERGERGSTLNIVDRGSGIDDETITRALLPFYSTKRGGSGLGLALCNEIVEAHGGRIRIARREGGGMAVQCWIPDE